jgi:hypothetical protein
MGAWEIWFELLVLVVGLLAVAITISVAAVVIDFTSGHLGSRAASAAARFSRSSLERSRFMAIYDRAFELFVIVAAVFAYVIAKLLFLRERPRGPARR